jgi:amino acid permease
MTSFIYSHVDKEKGKTYKPFYGAVTVMKSVVGSGILGLPYVISNFGPIIGALIFFIIFLIT